MSSAPGSQLNNGIAGARPFGLYAQKPSYLSLLRGNMDGVWKVRTVTLYPAADVIRAPRNGPQEVLAHDG